ncbi:MAG: hypothetical protein JW940_29440 [Polyangiaceae bacterium]|nr:hypothetical protein [Polyangiaceae bacterium]
MRVIKSPFGIAIVLLLASCGRVWPEGPSLSRQRGPRDEPIALGAHVPDTSEAETVGRITKRITRGSREYSRLVLVRDKNMVFKDEEGSAADRMMTPRLQAKLRRLAPLVTRTWPGVLLRITEAWDERGEHVHNSLHYEGRAADITTSDADPSKLGTLARLAVDAGLDWVYYENRSHVHVSVRR